MPETARNTTPWTEALREIEAEAGAPIIPGELRPWCDNLWDRLQRCRDRLAGTRSRQRATLDQVVREDPARAPLIDQWLERERLAKARLDHLKRELSVLRDEAAPQSDTSQEPTAAGERLRLAFLQWIVDERARDRELAAWYQEAQTRDRGVKD